MFGLGAGELLVIAVIVVLIFGRRLPEIGSGLGKAISNFKKSYKDSEAIDVTPGEEKKSEEKRS